MTSPVSPTSPMESGDGWVMLCRGGGWWFLGKMLNLTESEAKGEMAKTGRLKVSLCPVFEMVTQAFMLQDGRSGFVDMIRRMVDGGRADETKLHACSRIVVFLSEQGKDYRDLILRQVANAMRGNGRSQIVRPY